LCVSDISDRRKKRKLMPGQMYVNDDATVPSPIMNDCDISAKENNPSVITAGSQVSLGSDFPFLLRINSSSNIRFRRLAG
jgi:hypothetical protein